MVLSFSSLNKYDMLGSAYLHYSDTDWMFWNLWLPDKQYLVNDCAAYKTKQRDSMNPSPQIYNSPFILRFQIRRFSKRHESRLCGSPKVSDEGQKMFNSTVYILGRSS